MNYAEPTPTKGVLAEAQEQVGNIRATAAERAAVLRKEVEDMERRIKELTAAANEWSALANGIDKAENTPSLGSPRSY